VSRRHCAVEIHGNTALLIDLGSTNGTFVEDKKIDTAELEHLSEFRIGSSTVLFSVTDEERWEITGVPGKSA
jgi:pSer/pThr/pTyr-binding forkhead associated (FHA) protein